MVTHPSQGTRSTRGSPAARDQLQSVVREKCCGRETSWRKLGFWQEVALGGSVGRRGVAKDYRRAQGRSVAVECWREVLGNQTS